jgi:DNA primase
MAPRFGDSTIAEIRERTSIAEIVSRYVALRRAGRGYMGLCPFHAEKTPSFSVNDERGFFHCFGCGASGDVFKFLMRVENLAFPEAVERLAKELGLELSHRETDGARQEIRERLLELNARAAEYFRRCLWNERAGSAARAYLERRGVAEETSRRFGLGYAPPAGLVRALETAHVPLRDAEAVGLVARRPGGGLYDRFRDRLMFPIVDLAGKVVAFGGRVLGDGTPKYLNSPESPVFQKRRLLFGLREARDAIRSTRQAIVVEGYLDAIALSQAGLANVVAPLGTALTAEQARCLRRFAEEVVLLFDGDAAGSAAAARSFPVFAEAGVFADVAFLPQGHDPDSYVREAGSGGIERVLAGRIPLVDHYLRWLAPPDSPLSVRLRAAASVTECLRRAKDPLVRGLVARRAGEVLGVSEEEILRAAQAERGRSRANRSQPTPEDEPPAPLPPREAALLELLLLRPELRSRLPAPAAELLSDPRSRDLLDRILAVPGDPASLVGELPRSLRDRVAVGAEALPDPEAALRECLSRLEQERTESQLRRLREDLRSAEARDDGEAVRRLLGEIQRLAARARSC